MSKTANIEGVDLSPVYIEYATKCNREPRIKFRVGDICALPYEDASFDRLMSLLVLHFVPRTEDAVAEMRRVARPGATVAAAVWDARGGFVANRIFFDTAATLDQKGSDRRARNYTRPMTRPGELASAWRTCRFRKLRFVRIDGAIRRGSDAQQCLRAARLGVCRAHPSRAKCELVLHCNRCCISQEFAEGALR